MVGSVDYLSVDIGYGRCDPDDTPVLDEDVSLWEIPDLRIHRENMATTDKNSLHSERSLINTCQLRCMVRHDLLFGNRIAP